jgi:hypothetical protein
MAATIIGLSGGIVGVLLAAFCSHGLGTAAKRASLHTPPSIDKPAN